MINLLSRWVRRRGASSASHLTFTVYTRAQCCCCHKALDLLEEHRARYGYTVETVDVDGDPALAEAYGQMVPVVAVDGKVRFKGLVNPALLQRLLEAESRGR
jgi:glutaredoxin